MSVSEGARPRGARPRGALRVDAGVNGLHAFTSCRVQWRLVAVMFCHALLAGVVSQRVWTEACSHSKEWTADADFQVRAERCLSIAFSRQQRTGEQSYDEV